ncbi:MAG: pyruvate kinase [Alphaproteobacteria bacterium]|nr:pyruvate kinase [Alphaproteobacteria bacterium]
MNRNRQTKIVATLGPATSSRDTIADLFEAGTDVFRVNMSHGDRHQWRQWRTTLRELEASSARPVGMIADLQGPKLRIGGFRDAAVALERGQEFRIDLDPEPGDEARVGTPHAEIFAAIREGDSILLDDGKVMLRIIACGEDHAATIVEAGDGLSDHKGLNLPGVRLPIAALTPKDRDDLAFARELGVEWIALSFVQRPQDITEARALAGDGINIIAKLEKPAAIDSLEGIVDLADGIMVARGDLGVELRPEEVPGVQKRAIRMCREAGKPVIVATQMLDSMVFAPSPTRAEVTDVATAVYDGADALMLSGETSVGAFPVDAVSMMNRIMSTVEQDPFYDPQAGAAEATGADAISAAARQVAGTLGASAIVTYSVSGKTTLRASRVRPEVPILGLTPSITAARRLALAWGVHSVHTDDARSFSGMVEEACILAAREGFARSGESIVITAGVPFGTPGATNTLHVAQLD